MLNYDGVKVLVGAHELCHDISGEREQGDEDEDNPLLNGTQGPKDVGLPRTRLLNCRKVIWMHGMK